MARAGRVEIFRPGRNVAAAVWLTLALSIPAAAAPSTAQSIKVPDYVASAVADPSRPEADRKLDADRKPAQLLAFARVKPGQEVGEYLPGGGYYTRLLSQIVGPRGKVYALETTSWGKENIANTEAVLKEPGRTNVVLDLSALGSFRLPEKVDIFWTTINYHDLHVPKYGNVDMEAFNRAVFNSLKRGGTYLIVDHAAAPGTGATLSPRLHRIDRATVIEEVKVAGFVLADESDLLRNPADDHSKPVFDPSIRTKTDQFVLRFRKP
ncbi:MAG: methyltransferase [Alphaproteobacteria bacterium]|nr:methyltransferase [Alphaproteobacteria bacterium]